MRSSVTTRPGGAGGAGQRPVEEIFLVRQGAVTGVKGLAELSGGAFQYEAGDLFPLGAAWRTAR